MALPNQLMKSGSVRKFKQDEFIVFEGDSGQEMYIVLSGEVYVYINSGDFSQLKVTSLGPGSFFGEMSLLEDQPRSASVVAASDVTVLVIDKNTLHVFIREQPDLALKIMKGLSSRIRKLNEENMRLRKNSRPLTPETTPKQAVTSTRPPADAPSASKPKGPQIIETGDHPLFPKLHKQYGMIEPDSYAGYVYEKEIECPACMSKFKSKIPRMTKLKLERVEKDFRKIYREFDPLWYSMIVCPGCYYTNSFTEYGSLPDKYCKAVREQGGIWKNSFRMQFSENREVNQVFAAYYLALQCADIYKSDKLKKARLWLQLSWLYKDVDDKEMSEFSVNNAYDYYYEALYNSALHISTEQEQTLFILLGELSCKKGDKNSALQHLYKAINKKTGTASLNRMAADHIHELKTL